MSVKEIYILVYENKTVKSHNNVLKILAIKIKQDLRCNKAENNSSENQCIRLTHCIRSNHL